MSARTYTYEATCSWGGDTPTAELEVKVSFSVYPGEAASRDCPASDPLIEDITVLEVEGRASGWCDYRTDAELADLIIANLEYHHLDRMLSEAAETGAADRDDHADYLRRSRIDDALTAAPS